MYCIFKCGKDNKMEERKDCEFCEGSEKKQKGFTFLIDEDKELEVYHYESSDITYLEIKYCPMCGEKL